MKLLNKYEPRKITNLGSCKINSWHFKLYYLNYYPNISPSEKEWKHARALLKSQVDKYYYSKDELGLGYLILHKGLDTNYIVCSWWAKENMLRMFAFRAELRQPEQYELVEDGLNICVWDMQIHHFERDLFVQKILNLPASPDVNGYINSFYPSL